MAANPASPLPQLGPLYGAFYFATVLSTAFYGVTCMQTFIYYVHYQNDPLHMKIFVAILCMLNTIHEALVISGTYKYIMSGLLNPMSFLTAVPDLVSLLLLTAMVAVPSQGYFVYRIYIFTENKIVAPLIWVLLAILQLVSAAMYVGKGLYQVDGIRIEAVPITMLNNEPFTTLASLSLSVSAAVDILIAIFMTYLLVRSHSYFSTTQTRRMANMLQRLIVFSVNTGIWTATLALLTVILLRVYPENVLYAVPGVPICAVYCNTVLANLNGRAYIRREDATQNGNTDLFALSTWQVSNGTSRTDRRREETSVVAPTQKGVWKTTEVMVLSDANPSASSVKYGFDGV